MTRLSTKRLLGAKGARGRDLLGAPGRRCVRVVVLCLAPVILTLGSSPAVHAEDAPEKASPLTIHAFLTQGFGFTDGFTIFGIPEDGTTDLRSLALQIRYDLSENDVFVLQLNHERTGLDPVNELRPDVALDWAFYERRLRSGTSVKIGRIPVPFGIYNEIRDVGTILPFFRAPPTIYGEAGQAQIISQNVDGLLLRHDFPLATWSLEASVYGGQWGSFVRDQATGVVGEERYDDAFGVQLWLNAPTSGFRIGAAANRFTGPGLLTPAIVDFDYEGLLFSVEAPVGRFTFRGEYFDITADFDYVAYYALIGYKVTKDFFVFVQAEEGEFDLVLPPFGSIKLPLHEEWALGFNYWVSTDVLLKLEGHFSEGFAVQNVAINPFGPPFETDYGILSLAVSF